MDTENVSIILTLIIKQYLKIAMVIAAIIVVGQMDTAVVTATDIMMDAVVGSNN